MTHAETFRPPPLYGTVSYCAILFHCWAESIKIEVGYIIQIS